MVKKINKINKLKPMKHDHEFWSTYMYFKKRTVNSSQSKLSWACVCVCGGGGGGSDSMILTFRLRNPIMTVLH